MNGIEYRVKWIIEKQYPNSDETYLETIIKYFNEVELALELYWNLKSKQQTKEENIIEIHLDGIIKIKESVAN